MYAIISRDIHHPHYWSENSRSIISASLHILFVILKLPVFRLTLTLKLPVTAPHLAEACYSHTPVSYWARVTEERDSHQCLLHSMPFVSRYEMFHVCYCAYLYLYTIKYVCLFQSLGLYSWQLTEDVFIVWQCISHYDVTIDEAP